MNTKKAKIIKRLNEKYQEMYELTQEKCSKSCQKNTCCEENYCFFTKKLAEEIRGIELKETPNNRLPFQGDDGKCVLEPYLRPVCTLHICERFYTSDIVFGERYFKLREELDDLEFELRNTKK